MSIKITPELVEHTYNLLQRDYRNLKRAVNDADPEPYTKTILTRLGHTVDDVCNMLTELYKQRQEKK